LGRDAIDRTRAISSLLERLRMLDHEPDHEREEEGRQDEEKCCDDAKDESRRRFAATSEVWLRLDRVRSGGCEC
jgi:hypothetical protein